MTDTYIKPESLQKWNGFSTLSERSTGTFDWFKNRLQLFTDDRLYVQQAAKTLFKLAKTMDQKQTLSDKTLYAILASMDDTVRQQSRDETEIKENKEQTPVLLDTRRYHYNLQRNIAHNLRYPDQYMNGEALENANRAEQQAQETNAALQQDCLGPSVICINKAAAINDYTTHAYNKEMQQLNFPQRIGVTFNQFNTIIPQLNDSAQLPSTKTTNTLTKLMKKPMSRWVLIVGNSFNYPEKQTMLGWGSLLDSYMYENYQKNEGNDKQTQALFGTTLEHYHAFATERPEDVEQIKQIPVSVYAIDEQAQFQFLGKIYRGE